MALKKTRNRVTDTKKLEEFYFEEKKKSKSKKYCREYSLQFTDWLPVSSVIFPLTMTAQYFCFGAARMFLMWFRSPSSNFYDIYNNIFYSLLSCYS